MWVGREEEIPAYRLAHNQEATPATLGLFQACEAGDATKVTEFLAQNGRANYFDDIKGGTTPVHAACTRVLAFCYFQCVSARPQVIADAYDCCTWRELSKDFLMVC